MGTSATGATGEAPGDTIAESAVRLPPGPGIPKWAMAPIFGIDRRRALRHLSERYGAACTVDLPIYGRAVIVTEPDLARQVLLAGADKLGNIQPNLSRVLGSGSVFALDGAEHRQRRNILSPPFHGKAVHAYEPIFVEETMREMANWTEARVFPTLPSMMRITLNAILRAVFGAQGAELDDLRRIIPPWVTLGSRLVTVPIPRRTYGRFSPWGRLKEKRREYEAVIDRLIAGVRADPKFDERKDVLSIMLRGDRTDGEGMSRKDIGDELVTLLAAGHETTAATLAWVFERISRHPALLAELTAEVDAGGNTLRQATIREVQRARTVIDFCGRHVYAPRFEIGDWVLPAGCTVMVSIAGIHRNPRVFENPERFDPQRYLTGNPSAFEWLPYGGGTRRCPGSTFASLEMDTVLATILRHLSIEPTAEPAEKYHSRGVAFTPKRGGRITVHRRSKAGRAGVGRGGSG